MREERFTMLYDELFQLEDITSWDVILLSLIISFCHYAKSNEIYLKTKTLMQRFKRSESQVKRMIKRLEDKKLIAVYSKGYGHYKMRYIQAIDPRILALIGNVAKAPSVQSRVDSRKEYYQNMNILCSKDRITEQEIREVSNITPDRVLYYQVLLRCLREIKKRYITIDPSVIGYLKGTIADRDIYKITDVKRIVDGVRDAKIEGVSEDISIVRMVVISINCVPENCIHEKFSYERLEQELKEAKDAKSETEQMKVISLEDYRRRRQDQMEGQNKVGTYNLSERDF